MRSDDLSLLIKCDQLAVSVQVQCACVTSNMTFLRIPNVLFLILAVTMSVGAQG